MGQNTSVAFLWTDGPHLDFSLSPGAICGLDFRMAKPRRDELFDIAFLQQQAERYRSAAEATACEQERNYFIVMARLSETMAVNEKMRTWLDRTIQELKAVRMGAMQISPGSGTACSCGYGSSACAHPACASSCPRSCAAAAG